VSKQVRVDPTTGDTISQRVVSILKVLTEDLFVKDTELNWLEEALLVQLESTPEMKIVNQTHIDLVS